MGRKIQVTKNTATDKKEELLANLEMEGDRSHEITHLAGSEAEMDLELVIISKEI